MIKYRADNTSVVVGDSLMRKEKMIVVQALVSLFLSVNFMLITTFFMKDFFYTSMRYMFFANLLFSDSLFLLVSNLMLILSYFRVPVQMSLCTILFILSSLYNFVTPVTLTAMSLERYVAICMPLRHAELCSTRRALCCIFIIYSLSSVPCIVIPFSFFTSVSVYKQYQLCTVEVFITHNWLRYLRSAIGQFYFLIMFIIIVFSYVKIMKAAKAASGQNKKSTWKGLKTVILHAFQLLLCLIQLWCPLIEAVVLNTDIMLLINVRYFNYITFILAPRCLSPLIYGVRDEMFFNALIYFALCGFVKKKPLNFLA